MPLTRQTLARLVAVRTMARTGEARRLRERAGLSLSEMAAAVGVTKVAVLRWERGARAPRTENALRYGRVLDDLRGRS